MMKSETSFDFTEVYSRLDRLEKQKGKISKEINKEGIDKKLSKELERRLKEIKIAIKTIKNAISQLHSALDLSTLIENLR